MNFNDVNNIWKKNLEILGPDALKETAYVDAGLKRLKATDEILKGIGQDDIKTNIYYNLVSDCITEPMYSILLKTGDGNWFNQSNPTPFDRRELFLSCLKNETKFDKNFFIDYFQKLKSVGVRTFYEAAQKIDPNYQYEKLNFLRQVGALLAITIFYVDLNKITMFTKIPGSIDGLTINQQIDQFVQFALENDTSLFEEIEQIKLGKNNLQYWKNFEQDFFGTINYEIKLNNETIKSKTSNYFRKLFMIDK